MKHIALLGAGFSRNWGGWLADEAFGHLIGSPEAQADAAIRTALDLTGLFWTKRCEKMSLERSLGHAEEEV
jgi:hypothetical protein